MAAAEEHVEMNIPKEVEKLLKDFPELRVDRKKQRICCCLTGHEMPPREDAIRSYTKGKKFIRAQQNREFDYDAYKPHLIPSNKKGHENKLFCMLTYRHITRQPADVEKHVKGKRYQRALQRWQKCQETGEVFKPRGPKKKREDSMSDDSDSKSRAFWESDSDGDDRDVEDNMSDLYPSDDFASDVETNENGEQQTADDSDADFDFEDMDVPPAPNNKSGDAKPKSLKRKSKIQKGRAKKKRPS